MQGNKPTNDITTITVPYVPNTDGTPDSLEDWVAREAPHPDFRLHELQGSCMVKVDGEWSELGYNAIYKRLE